MIYFLTDFRMILKNFGKSNVEHACENCEFSHGRVVGVKGDV